MQANGRADDARYMVVPHADEMGARVGSKDAPLTQCDSKEREPLKIDDEPLLQCDSKERESLKIDDEPLTQCDEKEHEPPAASSCLLADLFGFTADALTSAVFKKQDTWKPDNSGEKHPRPVHTPDDALFPVAKTSKPSSEKLFDFPTTGSTDAQTSLSQPTKVVAFGPPGTLPGKCHNCGQKGHWASDCTFILSKMTASRDSKCALCAFGIRGKTDIIAKLAVGPFTYSWVHRSCAMEHLVTLGAI